MRRSTLDLWVGVFVTIGILAILFLALKVGNLTSVGSAPGYRLTAAFDNIGALKLRAPVKAAGVVVGRVEQIRLDPQTYQAVVSMKIDQGYQFTKDTIASVLTSGLLGEVYIGLDSGGDTKMLANGDRIAKTQSAIVLEKLIGQFLFDKAASGPASPPSGASNAASAPASGNAARPDVAPTKLVGNAAVSSTTAVPARQMSRVEGLTAQKAGVGAAPKATARRAIVPASRISIRASDATRVTACVDGAKVLDTLLVKGYVGQIPFSRQALLRFGNAGAIELAVGNQSAARLGQPGEARTIKVTPTGYELMTIQSAFNCNLH